MVRCVAPFDIASAVKRGFLLALNMKSGDSSVGWTWAPRVFLHFFTHLFIYSFTS